MIKMEDVKLRDSTHYKVMTFKSDGVLRRICGSERQCQKVGENTIP
jgi:hypothetical protein